jgi:hypothetical protein
MSYNFTSNNSLYRQAQSATFEGTAAIAEPPDTPLAELRPLR